MANKLKLTSIGLTTNEGKHIDLDIEEARDLFNQLRELFGKPDYVPLSPIIIERDPWTRPYVTWWQDQGTSVSEPAYRPTIICQGGSGLQVEYAGDVV